MAMDLKKVGIFGLAAFGIYELFFAKSAKADTGPAPDDKKDDGGGGGGGGGGGSGTTECLTADVEAKGETVKSIQLLLKQVGENPGTIDGSCGPMTKGATSSFQGKNGIKKTGVVDLITLARLNSKAKGAGGAGGLDRDAGYAAGSQDATESMALAKAGGDSFYAPGFCSGPASHGRYKPENGPAWTSGYQDGFLDTLHYSDWRIGTLTDDTAVAGPCESDSKTVIGDEL